MKFTGFLLVKKERFSKRFLICPADPPALPVTGPLRFGLHGKGKKIIPNLQIPQNPPEICNFAGRERAFRPRRVMIREVRIEDAEEIVGIYNDYILNTTVTFEIEPLSADDMRRRIADTAASYPYMVYVLDGKVVGYCYVHRWHERAAYEGVVELSVYLARQHVGRGIGTELTRRMIKECRRRGYRAIITCVTGGNDASLALQRKLGFTQVAHYKAVGLKFGRLIDVLDYELLM